MDEWIKRGRNIIIVICSFLLAMNTVSIVNSYLKGGTSRVLPQVVAFAVMGVLCLLTYLGHKWAKNIIEALIAVAIIGSIISIIPIFLDNILLGLIELIRVIVGVACGLFLQSDEVIDYMEFRRNKSNGSYTKEV